MDHAARLRQFGKKMITKSELELLYSVHTDGDLFSVVDALVQNKLIQPVKSSLTNGNKRFPIYMKYRISLPADDYSRELQEIAALHPALQSYGYLQSKPAQYLKYRSLIRKLDAYLFQMEAVPIPVSRKERSFEIFDEEKILDDRAFCALLESCGLDPEALGYYDTPEFCFNDYIPEKKSRMTLLICENKDIWFNIRRIMFEDRRFSIFGTPIDGVVYGCGNQISQKGALTHYTRFMGGADVSYLYWGDIDRAGLDIYLRLLRSNPALDIGLFAPAYQEMLHLAQNRNIPDSCDERTHYDDYCEIFGFFPAQTRSLLETSIRLNKRIPQEIISYAYLKENMR